MTQNLIAYCTCVITYYYVDQAKHDDNRVRIDPPVLLRGHTSCLKLESKAKIPYARNAYTLCVMIM